MIVKYNRHWKQTRLKYLFKIKKGVLPKFLEIEKGEDNYPYLSMKVLRGQKPNEFAKRNNCIFAVEGDIGILWDGSNAGEILKINVNGILSSTISLLKVKAIELDQGYAFYILKSYENFFKNNTVGMGIPHVDGNFLKNNHLPKPPLEEQKMISRYLDKKTLQIDLLVEKIQKKIELLKEQRTSLINQCVTKGLDTNVEMKESGVQWIGKIPNNWSISKVGRHFKLERGRVISNTEIFDNMGPYPVYSSQTKNNGKMGSINSFDFEGEYVSWTTDGAYAGTCFHRKGKFNITNVCGLLSSFELEINYHFLSLFLNIGSKAYVRTDINPKLMNDMMSQIPLLIVPIEEQNEIVSKVKLTTDKLDKIIIKEENRINILQEYRLSIISSVVTGKIRLIGDKI